MVIALLLVPLLSEPDFEKQPYVGPVSKPGRRFKVAGDLRQGSQRISRHGTNPVTLSFSWSNHRMNPLRVICSRSPMLEPSPPFSEKIRKLLQKGRLNTTNQGSSIFLELERRCRMCQIVSCEASCLLRNCEGFALRVQQ